MPTSVQLVYLIAAVLFILAIRGLASPKTARRGNLLGMIGMGLAVLATLMLDGIGNYGVIIAGVVVGGGIGTLMALKVKMTGLPQMVALFNSFVGLASVGIAIATFYNPEVFGIGKLGAIRPGSLLEMSLGMFIGAVTFTGSVLAFLKLNGQLKKPVRFKGQAFFNLGLKVGILALIAVLMGSSSPGVFWLIIALSFLLGVTFVLPIGGADMPVVVSLLNSYSGWASVGVGFTMQNPLMIIAGSLVGASGAILSYIMCKGMNRSLINVLLGGMGDDSAASGGAAHDDDRQAKLGAADDAAFIMSNASSVIIVPGYGMAVAQAQHALKEMADILKANGAKVSYAIHPVAGRMPGHMNVLLAEANVPYEDVKELEEINRDFPQADVAYVIGANDVTNPAAKDDPSSPIYGMPVLDVSAAKTVLFVKRSMGSGYAGIENGLFYADNTLMLLGDGKTMTESVVKALKAA